MHNWFTTIATLSIVFVTVYSIRLSFNIDNKDRKQTQTRWEKAKSLGVSRYLAIHAAPFAIGYSMLGPMGRAWHQTGHFGYATDNIVVFAATGLGAGTLGALLRWRGLREAAQLSINESNP